MKLYYSKGACSLAVRIVIHEIGIPCDFEAVNLHTKLTENGADFLNINPKGAVPTLALDDGEVLTENAVIQQYLADTNKTSLLPPQGDIQRYHALKWLNFVSTDLHKSFSPLFNPKLPEEVKEEIFKPLIKSKLSFVNQHLAQQRYLLGDQFTLADSYLFVILTWVPKVKLNIEDWPNLVRYFNEVKNRPAVQKALKEEDLNFNIKL